MKQISSLIIVVVVLMAMFVSGCGKPPTQSGDIEKCEAKITVNSDSKIVPNIGDRVRLVGDGTVRHDSTLVRLYGNNTEQYIELLTWDQNSELSDLEVDIYLRKETGIISGFNYYVVKPNGDRYPLTAQYRLISGGQERILDRIYQPETADTTVCGFLYGLTYNSESNTFIPYGEYSISQLQPAIVRWYGIPDYTSYGNGMVEFPDSLLYVQEQIMPNMNMGFQSSWSNMGMNSMTWNSALLCYEATIMVVPCSRQSITVIERNPWDQKLFGITMTSGGETEELINMHDSDNNPLQIHWVFDYGLDEDYEPFNLEWNDDRLDFEIAHIIPD